jgi:peptidoglycan hydrolase CwlO-like protein
VVKERKKDVEEAENTVDLAVEKIEEMDAKIIKVIQTRKAEVEGDKKRRQEVGRLQAKIKDFEARLQHPPDPFDPEHYNTRIVSASPSL